MRIVGVRERIEIGLQNIVAVPIGEIVEGPVVLARELGSNVRVGGFGQR